MNELGSGLETKPLSDKYSGREIFEHLFPGNHFSDLPRINRENARIVWKLYMAEGNRRRKDFIEAVTDGRNFAERENCHPDKLTMAYYTRGLTPSGRAPFDHV